MAIGPHLALDLARDLAHHLAGNIHWSVGKTSQAVDIAAQLLVSPTGCIAPVPYAQLAREDHTPMRQALTLYLLSVNVCKKRNGGCA